jgi:hypothetical protein
LDRPAGIGDGKTALLDRYHDRQRRLGDLRAMDRQCAQFPQHFKVFDYNEMPGLAVHATASLVPGLHDPQDGLGGN